MEQKNKLDNDRYETLLRMGQSSDGSYRIHEIDRSGKGDRITWLNEGGEILEEIILI